MLALVSVKSPVAVAVAVVVANLILSADSSHPINTLSPVLPRSINKPRSLALLVAPLLSSIKLSSTVLFVVVILAV